MNVLNLYAGVGGNRALWENVAVTAVEKDPRIAAVYQRLHPKDTVVVGDAHTYLVEHFSKFDFIWTSPPCQSHSRMMVATRHDVKKYPDMALYQEILFLKQWAACPWVVENVIPYYTPLIPAKKVGRHLFWSSFDFPEFEVDRSLLENIAYTSKQVMMDWLGIHFPENIYYGGNHCTVQILRNCVHPKLGQHILKCIPDDY